MRNNYKFISFLLVVLLLFTSVLTYRSVNKRLLISDLSSTSTFILPQSLLLVGESAFEATPVETVIFSPGLLQIGNRAFANMENLSDVYLPSSVTSISDSAFLRNSNLTIHGVTGSYAQQWSDKNNLSFLADYDRAASSKGEEESHPEILEASVFYQYQDPDEKTLAGTAETSFSMRPQDRPELHPINLRFP